MPVCVRSSLACKENRRRRLLFSCKEKARSQESKVIRNLHGNVYQSLTGHSFFGFPLELKSRLHFWKRCTLHLNLFSLSVSERECKAIYLENQYIFTVSAWLKVMDISKTCRAWLCKCPSVLSSFVHTILPPPDINIDLLVTFFFLKADVKIQDQRQNKIHLLKKQDRCTSSGIRTWQ